MQTIRNHLFSLFYIKNNLEKCNIFMKSSKTIPKNQHASEALAGSIHSRSKLDKKLFLRWRSICKKPHASLEGSNLEQHINCHHQRYSTPTKMHEIIIVDHQQLVTNISTIIDSVIERRRQHACVSRCKSTTIIDH